MRVMTMNHASDDTYCCGLHNVIDNVVCDEHSPEINWRAPLFASDRFERPRRSFRPRVPVNAEGLRQVARRPRSVCRESHTSQTLRKTDLLAQFAVLERSSLLHHSSRTAHARNRIFRSAVATHLVMSCCSPSNSSSRQRQVRPSFQGAELQLNGSAGLYSSQSPEEETFPTQSAGSNTLTVASST